MYTIFIVNYILKYYFIISILSHTICLKIFINLFIKKFLKTIKINIIDTYFNIIILIFKRKLYVNLKK